MKKVFLLLIASVSSLSLKGMDVSIQTKKTLVGTNWTMVTNTNRAVGAINSIDSQYLVKYASVVFDSGNVDQLNQEIRLAKVIKEFDAQYSLQDSAVLGCLYVLPTYRGNGFARELVTKACSQLTVNGIKKLFLLPDPFEYVDGKPVVLQNKSQYALKKDKLIQLFQSNGFIVDQAEDVTYMHFKE